MILAFESDSHLFWGNCFYIFGTFQCCYDFLQNRIIFARHSFSSSEDSDVTYENAVLYATGLVLLLAGYAALLNTYLFTALHNAMKVRAGVCSVIYRKASGFLHDVSDVKNEK